MSTPSHSISHANRGISPEKLEALMHAARVERAKAVRRLLRALFRRRRENDAWLQAKAPGVNLDACR